jgi:hypothetical protein
VFRRFAESSRPAAACRGPASIFVPEKASPASSLSTVEVGLIGWPASAAETEQRQAALLASRAICCRMTEPTQVGPIAQVQNDEGPRQSVPRLRRQRKDGAGKPGQAVRRAILV